MNYFILGILFFIVLLMVISSRAKIPDELDAVFYTKPFYKIGAFIYKRLKREEHDNKKNQYLKKIYDAKKKLKPAGKTDEEVRLYFSKKIGLITIVLFVGLLFTLLAENKSNKKTFISEDNSIIRSEYGKSADTYTLDAQIDGIKIDDIELDVESKWYTEEELDEMIPDFLEKLEKSFLGSNESLDRITKSVNLAERIDKYPFEIEYEWDRHEILNIYGEIGDEVKSDGELLEMKVMYRYRDYAGEYSFGCMIFPKELNEIDMLKAKIENKISEINNDSCVFYLPTEIDGMAIKWSEQKKQNTIIFVAVIIVGVVALFWGEDRDLYKEIDKRNKQMLDDYPEVVSKITLLLGAGLSIKSAWKKIATDYKKLRDNNEIKERYIYEEMLYSYYELESGIDELTCYRRFSTRCKLQKYIKLAALLEQNVRMGSKEMIENLNSETREAFTEKRNSAEKKGEEAGTKLLVPMIMMLIIVMVIIMYPALSSM